MDKKILWIPEDHNLYYEDRTRLEDVLFHQIYFFQELSQKHPQTKNVIKIIESHQKIPFIILDGRVEIQSMGIVKPLREAGHHVPVLIFPAFYDFDLFGVEKDLQESGAEFALDGLGYGRLDDIIKAITYQNPLPDNFQHNQKPLFGYNHKKYTLNKKGVIVPKKK